MKKKKIKIIEATVQRTTQGIKSGTARAPAMWHMILIVHW